MCMYFLIIGQVRSPHHSNQLSESLQFQWYQELTYGNLVPTGIKLKIKGLL